MIKGLKMLKIFICVLAVLIYCIKIDAQQKKVYSHFTKLECKWTEKVLRENIYPNFTCYIKNYGKKLSTFNVYYAMRTKVPKLFVSPKIKFLSSLKVWFQFTGTFFFKSGSTYREVIKTPVTDYCAVMRSASSNIFIKQIMEDCRQAAPDLVKECPIRDSTLR